MHAFDLHLSKHHANRELTEHKISAPPPFVFRSLAKVAKSDGENSQIERRHKTTSSCASCTKSCWAGNTAEARCSSHAQEGERHPHAISIEGSSCLPGAGDRVRRPATWRHEETEGEISGDELDGENGSAHCETVS